MTDHPGDDSTADGPDEAAAIAIRLDALLSERQMTLTELSDRVGVTIVNLSVLKNGRARAIRFSTLARLCRALDCQPGDLLRIVTLHSEYYLTIVKGRDAILVCPQPGRPAGTVSIMGCTFGLSSSIKPDHLFCGGNLELSYQLEGVSMTHTTTAIKEIDLQRTKK